MLTLWWVALHALAAAGFLASGLPLAVELAGVAAGIVHAVLRRPLSAPALRYAGGQWDVPEQGLARLLLVRATVGPFAIELLLGGQGRQMRVLLLRDQFDDAAWRALQAELRRA